MPELHSRSKAPKSFHLRPCRYWHSRCESSIPQMTRPFTPLHSGPRYRLRSAGENTIRTNKRGCWTYLVSQIVGAKPYALCYGLTRA